MGVTIFDRPIRRDPVFWIALAIALIVTVLGAVAKREAWPLISFPLTTYLVAVVVSTGRALVRGFRRPGRPTAR
jgi:predicted RND superfamily exporter protein